MVNLSDLETEATYDRIAAMRLVEDAPAYQCSSYLNEDLPSHPMTSANDSIDADCRAKMVNWSLSIVDYCGFNRETVAVALSFVDRFLSQRTTAATEVLSDRRKFQLLFMAALHIAVKTREQMQLDGPLLSKLSRGTYAANEFIEYERHLLELLGWRVSGPTAMDFVREYLLLLPKNGVNPSVQARLLDCAQRQSELAMRDFKFTTIKRSVVGQSAILNSIESMGYHEFPSRQRAEFFATLEDATGLDTKCEVVFESRLWLQEACISICATTTGDHKHESNTTHAQRDHEHAKGSAGESKSDSPVCVSRLSFSRR
uniref:Cyclin-like domain-containing protein n=1 Tax=Odontella aurita TaxID=265563 RepID=A0A7S4J0F2_9STRA|mmetsp:Transcript_34860/g.103938  ORF Transcript_34860/g.103938 Transcript_34860/m.103938 type:complete len:315 (+) Transcript_34860:133-1077(+)